MNKLVRRSVYTAAVAILCFAPGAFAQRQSSATSIVTLARPAVAVMFPLHEDRKRKRVTAPEGGATALYLALAGACCFGAMFVQSRKQRAENAL